MKLNYLFILCAIILAFILVSSCRDDEKPVYSFKTQDTSGKIGNTPWTYADGYAQVSPTLPEVGIHLFEGQGESGCNVFLVDGNEVYFYVPNKVGLYKLKYSTDDPFYNSISLYENERSLNHVAYNGAIEIVSITDTAISGRIDASMDGENFVNGNFTVNFCD